MSAWHQAVAASLVVMCASMPAAEAARAEILKTLEKLGT